MKFTVDILSVINLLLLFGVVIMIVLFYLKWSNTNKTVIAKTDINNIPFKEESAYNVEIQKIICRSKDKFQATKIIIALFHDGGNFVNGLHMKKFSVIFETEGGTYIPMMDKCINIFNSRYSVAFAQLAALDYYCLVDRDTCEDLNFKRDMKEWDFQSSNLFMMKQFDGKDFGFIGINFRNSHVMGPEERAMVKEQIPIIVGLLNMNK